MTNSTALTIGLWAAVLGVLGPWAWHLYVLRRDRYTWFR